MVGAQLEAVGDLGGHHTGHRGLADAGGPEQRDEPPLPEAFSDLESLPIAPDQLHRDPSDSRRDAVELLLALRAEHETPTTPVVVGGVVGPRGDGYQVGATMTPEEARN